MIGFIGSMDAETRFSWAKSQAYIALGTTLSAAADLRIDSCPMEGFVPDQFMNILGLESENLKPAAMLPIGYRSEEDVYSKMPKVRKTREDFVIEVN